MTTRALIADDEPHLARALQAELAALWPELQVVAVARNGVEAAERIAALQPELAFLDIQMPGLSGLEVAQGIEGTTRVVFVTAYDEYAVQAFEAEAVDYVLKPVSRERLQRTVQRIRRTLAAPSAGPGGSQRASALYAFGLSRRRQLFCCLTGRCPRPTREPRPAPNACAGCAPAPATSRTRSTYPRCCSSAPTTNTPVCKRRRPNI